MEPIRPSRLVVDSSSGTVQVLCVVCGGMSVCVRERLATPMPPIARALRDHEQSARFGRKMPGLNSGLDALPDAKVHGHLECARRFADCEVSLPLNPFLSNDDGDRVIDRCNAKEG